MMLFNADKRIIKVLFFDTSLLLFCLSFELGWSLHGLSLAGLSGFLFWCSFFSFVVFPYFVTGRKMSFQNWILGRFLIVGYSFFIGWFFEQSLMSILPKEFFYIPLFFLIICAMLTFYIHFYSFLKLRS